MNSTCPLCDSSASLYLHTRDYNRRITNLRFDYYRCSNCQLIFLDPIPDDLGRYYDNDYYPIPTTREELAQRAAGEQYKFDLVQRFRTGAENNSLLEIGSSYGAFAFLAQTGGYDVTVIEQDARCCDFLRETAGVTALRSDDPAHTLESLGQFDVITLWQAIEHISNPGRLLKVVGEHLKPGGFLLMSTPNPESLQFGLFRRHWQHLDAPRHVQLFPIAALDRALEASGLHRVHITTLDAGSQGIECDGWVSSIFNKFHVTPLNRVLPPEQFAVRPVAERKAILRRHPELWWRVPFSKFGLLLNRLFKGQTQRDLKGATYAATWQKKDC